MMELTNYEIDLVIQIIQLYETMVAERFNQNRITYQELTEVNKTTTAIKYKLEQMKKDKKQ